MTCTCYQAADLADGYAEVARRSGQEAAARALEAFARVLRARARDGTTDRVLVAVCRVCGGPAE